MTPEEAKAAIRSILTPRITKEKEAEAMDIVIDLVGGSVGEEFPDWSALKTFQTDGTDDGKQCKHPDTSGKKRLWETLVDDNINHEPPTDPEVTSNSYWKEISAAVANPTIFKTRPVRAATIAALPSYNVLSSGDILEATANGILTVDGVQIYLNDEILVKDEATNDNNGIFRCIRVGTASQAWKLQRRGDAKNSGGTGPGYLDAIVYVTGRGLNFGANFENYNQNSGKFFHASAFENGWTELEHSFFEYVSPAVLTTGDVVKRNFIKVSSADDVPYAVVIKHAYSPYFIFQRSGFLNGLLTGLSVGALIYVQPSGTLGTTQSRWLFGVAVKSNSVQILNLRMPIDDDAMTDNSALFPPTQKSAKAYTDAQVAAALSGLKWKEPCRVATTANITLSGAQTIDGVSVIDGDRVLVKDQSTASQNGIYVCASGSWTRATDADSGAELQSATVPVNEGTANADTTWRQSADSITLGSTSISWIPLATTVPDASETVKGKIELATQSEVNAGTDDLRGITPLKLKTFIDGYTVSATQGGTGFNSYTVGDLLSASTTTALSKIAAVAAGSYLRSAGVGTLPVWSTLILPNSATANRLVYATSANTYGESANLVYDGTSLIVNATTLLGTTGSITANTRLDIRGISSGGGAQTALRIANNANNQRFTIGDEGNIVQSGSGGSAPPIPISTSVSFAPASGSGTLISWSLTPTLNTTGTYSGSIYGIRYAPTGTSSTGATHRAWSHTMGFVEWASVLSPTQITSNQDNYNPTGWTNGGAPHGASIVRHDVDSTVRDITGFTGGTDGRISIHYNINSTNPLRLRHDVSSTAANRYYLPNSTDIIIPPNGVWLQVYDSASQRNRVIAMGTVIGSVGTTDNALLRADGTGGFALQNSPVIISDTGDIDLGVAATAGTSRTISAKGTNSDYDLIFINKGLGFFQFNTTSGSARFKVGGSATAGLMFGDWVLGHEGTNNCGILFTNDGSTAGIMTNANLSRDIIIKTQDNGAGNSRNIYLRRGTASGTRGNIFMDDLPTSDPGISGALWKDGSNFVKVSP